MLPKIFAILMIMLQSWMVAEHANQPHVLWLFGFGVPFLSFIANDRVRIRWSPFYHVAMVAIMVAGVFLMNALWPPVIRNDWLIPGKYVVVLAEMLIVCQLVEVLVKKTGQGLSLRFPALMLCGFLVIFFQIETPLNAFKFFTAAALLGGYFLLPNSATTSKNEKSASSNRTRWAIFLSGWLLMVLLSNYFANGAKSAMGMVRYLVSDKVVELTEIKNARVGYATSGNFSEINKVKQLFPEQVAVSVTCPVMPGYLRGRAFSDLTQNGWREHQITYYSPEKIDPPENGNFLASSNPAFQVFEVKSGSEDLIYVEAENDRSHIGKVVFTPLHVSHVEAQTSELKADHHDIIRDGVDQGTIYRSFLPRQTGELVLPEQLQRRLTFVAPYLRQRVGGIAEKVGEGLQSDEQIIAAVETYFRENYEYSLEPFETPRKTERLTYFILEKPAAHCEYFASAAALFLRFYGIPTRYVTGFTVTRPSTSDENDGEMWVAHNQDAHAWVEAFDRQEKKWKIVEATPGHNFPKDIANESTMVESGISVDVSDSGLGQLNRQFFQNLAVSFSRWYRKNRWLANWLFVALLSPFVLLGLRRWQLGRYRKSSDYSISDLAAQMRRMDRKLRKVQLVRAPSETLGQFADRISKFNSPESHWVLEFAEKYRAYERQCYAST